MPSLENAIRLAVDAHTGQTDKSGAPYILHPLRVMFAVEGEEARMAAVLHDVVEESHYTFGDLRREGYPEPVLAALDCLTKRPEEENDYAAFIDRVKENPLARIVKLADLVDNMDIRRLAEVDNDDLSRLQKYRRAWEELTQAKQGMA